MTGQTVFVVLCILADAVLIGWLVFLLVRERQRAEYLAARLQRFERAAE